jgi:hypothetical protein
MRVLVLGTSDATGTLAVMHLVKKQINIRVIMVVGRDNLMLPSIDCVKCENRPIKPGRNL